MARVKKVVLFIVVCAGLIAQQAAMMRSLWFGLLSPAIVAVVLLYWFGWRRRAS
jgi:hypothetical protein